MTPAPDDRGRRFPDWAAAALLGAAAFLVYWPALHGTWLWDDNVDLTENLLLRDAAGLWRIWFAPTTLDYYPLKFTVQWLQWQLWGDQVLGYHVTNVVLHALSGVLLWRVFKRLGLALAGGGALLFVVHPLAVESVAWMAELKNTLSLPPLLLALLAFLAHEERGRPGVPVRALAWFLIAMLCKTSVVMFPVTLLLFRWWKRGRLTGGDVRTLAPFFGLSLVLGMVTVWFQFGRALGGESLAIGGPLARLALAGSALAFYAGKALWPAGLLPIYPQWPIDPPAAWHALPWIVIATVGLLAWCHRSTWGRAVGLGAGWFVLHLLPFVGFITISFLRFTWVMDHLAYVALPGLIGLALAGLQRVRPVALAHAGLAVAAGVAALAARRHAATYRDARTFWSHAVQHHGAAWLARNNLGLALSRDGDLRAAAAEFEQALRLNPAYFEARMNLGNTLRQLGRPAEGIPLLEAAVRQRPEVAAAHYNLGLAHHLANRPDEALAHYERALRLKPDFADALDGRGEILRQARRYDEARRDFTAALKSNPAAAEVHHHLALLLQATKDPAGARVHFDHALRLRPAYAEAHNNLGTLLVAAGQATEAIGHFRQAIAARPDFVDALFNRAVVLASLGRHAEAVPDFTAVLRLQPDSLKAHYNLANTLVAQREFTAAISHYEHALALDASYAEIHVRLAEALAAAGRPAAARERYAAARIVNPALPARDF